MLSSWFWLPLILLISISTYLYYQNLNLIQEKYQLTQKLNINRQKRRHQQELLEILQEEIKHNRCLNAIAEIIKESTNLSTVYQSAIKIIFDFFDLELIYILNIIPQTGKNELITLECKNNYLIKHDVASEIDSLIDHNSKYSFDHNLTVFNQLILVEFDHPIQAGINFNIVDNYDTNQRKILGLYSQKQNIFEQPAIIFVSQIIALLENFIKNYQQQQKCQLFDKVVNSTEQSLCITFGEPTNSIIYVNQAFEKMTGFTREEINRTGLNFHQIFEQHENILAIPGEKITGNNKASKIICCQKKNGNYFWLKTDLIPIYDKQKQIKNLIYLQTDVSEIYQIEKHLIQQNKKLAILNEQVIMINHINHSQEIDLSEVLNVFLKKVQNIIHVDIIAISELLVDKHKIVSLYNSLSSDNFYPQENNLINYFAQKVLIQRNTVSYHQNSSESNYSEQQQLKGININFYLGSPIYIGKKIYGVLHLLNISETENKFYESKHLIRTICQTISHIIQILETKLEKEQINIALQESQKRLSITLSSLEDIIWSIHPDTLQLTYINQSAEKFFNVPLGKLFQKRLYWLELIDDKDQARIKNRYSNLLNVSLLGNQYSDHDLEYRIVLKDGTEKYIRDRAHTICDEQGDIISINGIITDITDSIKTQKALTKSEQEFRLLFELAAIGMIITNLEGTIIQVNHSFCDLVKKSAQELINQNETTIIHPDYLAKFLDFKRKIITESLEQDCQEICLLANNGSLVHTIFNVTVLRNDKGAIQQFIQQIIDISELKFMGEQIFYDTFYDKLTGLPNRFLLIDRLKQYLKINQQRNDYSVLLIDIDNFKKINDSWGHKIGDELLVLISEKMINCLDSKDVLARISGDEFVVFIPDIASVEEVKKTAEKIITACSINTTIRNKTVICSVSIGIVINNGQHLHPEEMIRNADLAMSAAKEKGKNCYQIFDNSMHLGLVKKINLESALAKVIEKQELELYYQPIINLQTGVVAGFEALIRWQSPTHGCVSPVDFIPIAEETGLIIPMGHWILLVAAEQIKQWQQKYPELNLFIAVNVSSKQLLHSSFLQEIDLILQQSQIDPALLKIEITESTLMEKYEDAQKILQQLKKRDLKISLDDFGTGYSSLSYLHRLPFDTLKIDRSFVEPLTNNPEQPTPIVEAIVNLADNLSLDVVAEGIEIELQETILKQINCKYGQGYLYAKPLNQSQADKFIQDHHIAILNDA